MSRRRELRQPHGLTGVSTECPIEIRYETSLDVMAAERAGQWIRVGGSAWQMIAADDFPDAISLQPPEGIFRVVVTSVRPISHKKLA